MFRSAKDCLLLTLNVLLGLDEDTVQELTDILLLDKAKLVHDGGLAGDLIQVVALEDDLILDLGGVSAVNLDTGGDGLLADALLTQEVADLDLVALNGDVDGEMGVGETELVAESLGDTGDAVADVGDGGVEGGDVNLTTEPADGGEGAGLLVDTEVQLEVGQVLGEGSALTLDLDDAVLDGDLDALGEGVGGARLDLHSYTTRRRVMDGSF